MTDRELMQQTLEALDQFGSAEHHPFRTLCAALRERLARQEQEPVVGSSGSDWVHVGNGFYRKRGDTAPQPAVREWQGLDQKEMLRVIDQQQAYGSTGLPMFYRDQCLSMARAIEQALRERNA